MISNLTVEDALEIEREYCRRSLANFARRAWKIVEPSTPLKWGWCLDVICEHLEAITRGEIKRLVINVPPGSMKSMLTSVFWPAWEWGAKNMPHLRIISTSYKRDLALRDNVNCRRIIQSDWYQSLFGHVTLFGDQNAVSKFANTSMGFREAIAFEGITGSRGDRVINDDPHSVEEANSIVQLQTAIRAFRETMPTRVNNDQSAIVIIMQRVNEGDVSAVALELGYEHLCLPMRYDGKSKWVVGNGDPRKIDGELMFPERFSEDQVKELEKSLGSYGTASQLQQSPSPRGGGIIKTPWYKFYQKLPELKYKFITADTAQKTEEQNDYSVFQCWGATATGQLVLIDQLRGKWEAPELLIYGRSFWQKNLAVGGVPCRAMYIEDKVSGTGLIQTLRREGFSILPMQRNRDKISRGYDAAPYIESGNVYLPELVDWLSDFLRESEAFPAGKHDDQLDPMFDAINIIQSNMLDYYNASNDVEIESLITENIWSRR